MALVHPTSRMAAPTMGSGEVDIIGWKDKAGVIVRWFDCKVSKLIVMFMSDKFYLRWNQGLYNCFQLQFHQ